MEVLQRVPLLADTEQLDRLAGDGAHRKCRAAAGIAIGARQHDASDADALVERLGDVDRVLTGKAIGDEQRLVRARDIAHFDGFAHQLVVDVDAAGGVEQHHVVTAEARRIDRPLHIAAASARRRSPACQRRSVCSPSTRNCSCAAGSRRVSSRRHPHLFLVAVGEPLGDLRRRRRSAGALQADHHHGDRRQHAGRWSRIGPAWRRARR